MLLSIRKSLFLQWKMLSEKKSQLSQFCLYLLLLFHISYQWFIAQTSNNGYISLFSFRTNCLIHKRLCCTHPLQCCWAEVVTSTSTRHRSPFHVRFSSLFASERLLLQIYRQALLRRRILSGFHRKIYPGSQNQHIGLLHRTRPQYPNSWQPLLTGITFLKWGTNKQKIKKLVPWSRWVEKNCTIELFAYRHQLSRKMVRIVYPNNVR